MLIARQSLPPPANFEAVKPKKKKKKWWIPVLIILVIIIAFFWLIGSGDDSASTPEQPSFSKSEMIENCEEFAYTDLARNPDNYNGKYAKFKGQVIQVQESGNNMVLRVNVTYIKYEFDDDGYYEDTIYVNYTKKDANESRILEDDIVTMYGTLKGIETYESIFGEEISIPSFTAEYIDIETK